MFCLRMRAESGMVKVHMSMWLLASGLPLLESKTEMGVALVSSAGLRAIGLRMWLMKICRGFMFCVR